MFLDLHPTGKNSFRSNLMKMSEKNLKLKGNNKEQKKTDQ